MKALLQTACGCSREMEVPDRHGRYLEVHTRLGIRRFEVQDWNPDTRVLIFCEQETKTL